jgi:hypothetical protein
MARIQSVYNDIGMATDDITDIINSALQRGPNYAEYLGSYLEGGADKWANDMEDYMEKYALGNTEYNELNTMGILKNQPELYVRLALAKMKQAKDKGAFSQLSDKEFDSLVDEFKSDPSNFTPAKRRAISIKYDKELQKDIATKKGISVDDVTSKMSDFQKDLEEQQLQEWTKRQWQLRAGIIK